MPRRPAEFALLAVLVIVSLIFTIVQA